MKHRISMAAELRAMGSMPEATNRRALTLAQAERDTARQERDELRAALERLVSFRDDACKGAGEDFSRGQRVWQEARAVLAPKATQPTSEASRGR